MVELSEETGCTPVSLERETGEEQIIVGWARRKDGG